MHSEIAMVAPPLAALATYVVLERHHRPAWALANDVATRSPPSRTAATYRDAPQTHPRPRAHADTATSAPAGVRAAALGALLIAASAGSALCWWPASLGELPREVSTVAPLVAAVHAWVANVLLSRRAHAARWAHAVAFVWWLAPVVGAAVIALACALALRSPSLDEGSTELRGLGVVAREVASLGFAAMASLAFARLLRTAAAALGVASRALLASDELPPARVPVATRVYRVVEPARAVPRRTVSAESNKRSAARVRSTALAA